MGDLLFTSDTHFGQKTMVTKYRARMEFDSVEAHDEFLIEHWNARVKPGDDVHFLGDFSFYGREAAQEIIDRLHGRKHLTLGNHDNPRRLARGWESVEYYRELHVDRQMIVLFHFPIVDWHGIHRGSWHLHGHSHGNSPADPDMARLDVGVDAIPWWGPVRMDDLTTLMAGRTGTAPGHHTRGAP